MAIRADVPTDKHAQPSRPGTVAMSASLKVAAGPTGKVRYYIGEPHEQHIT